jgi:hypothetical protein
VPLLPAGCKIASQYFCPAVTVGALLAVAVCQP